MGKIKFYSESDISIDTNIKSVIEFVNKFNNTSLEVDINKILKYLNIIKFCENENVKNVIITETEGRIDNVIRIIKKEIGKFISIHKSDKFLSLYEEVSIEYREDFLELVDKFNVFEHIEKPDFAFFLKKVIFTIQ